ncbi:MAG: hypothetical protein ACOCY7_01995 [Halodesulfurarchaeum sp.]
MSTVYVFTHPHPAYEGGLYLQIVEQIRTGDYRLPSRIPYYTDVGIPFAYPPLMFYLTALVIDVTGVDPVWLMSVLPGMVILAYLVPYYLLASELLETPRRAGFATLVFGVAPPVLQWHLSSGGIVRAPAMLLTLVGTYTGLKLFRTGERRWLVSSTVLWGLVLLSHPVYTTFFGWTYILFFFVFDRTRAGVIRGAAVAVGGFVLASPWWTSVISRHGIDVFLAASNSRSTLGGGIHRLVTQFVWPLQSVDAILPFYLFAFAGTVYAAHRRRWVLPIWLVSVSYLIGKHRFIFVSGSMLAAIFVFEVVFPLARQVGEALDRERIVVGGVTVLLVVGSTGVGVAYAGSAIDTNHQTSTTMPKTVGVADEEAMTWVRSQTDPSASFVVVGDAAEWFPYYSKRTIHVSPWGTEWTDRFDREVDLFLSMSTCHSLYCLEPKIRAAQGTPQYLYVPTREYTVRGQEQSPRGVVIDALLRSEEYDLRYANRGVMIFERSPTASSLPP